MFTKLTEYFQMFIAKLFSMRVLTFEKAFSPVKKTFRLQENICKNEMNETQSCLALYNSHTKSFVFVFFSQFFSVLLLYIVIFLVGYTQS